MRRSRSSRQVLENRPIPGHQAFIERLIALRETLETDPAEAGNQGLRLLEEYVEQQAKVWGYLGEGSLGRYIQYLRGHSNLATALLDQGETYVQARNCLAHNYGLQPTPAFADEILDFLELLLKQDAITAEQLMTHDVRSVQASDTIKYVRDLMLRGGYSRLPVLQENDGILGLLTERDVVAAQTLAEQTQRSLAKMRVEEALPEDATERFVLIAPSTPRAQVAEYLRKPGVIACLVTADGQRNQRPIGIITHADLLYRM